MTIQDSHRGTGPAHPNGRGLRVEREELSPRFDFTDPTFRRSLPMILAFAATAIRPTAVLTGPRRGIGDWPGPTEPDPAAGPDGTVRARVEGSPLTATAALA